LIGAAGTGRVPAAFNGVDTDCREATAKPGGLERKLADDPKAQHEHAFTELDAGFADPLHGNLANRDKS